MTKLAQFNDAEGMAALSICESLLLALIDLKIISEQGAGDVLVNVATTHTEAAAFSQTPERHQAVVKALRRVLICT